MKLKKQKRRETYPQKGNAAPSCIEEERLQERGRISALGWVEDEGKNTKKRKGEAELISKSRKLREKTEWKEVSKGVKEQDPEQPPKKSQRFIVFIGMFHLYQDWILSHDPFREPPVHCDKFFYHQALCLCFTKFCSPSHS